MKQLFILLLLVLSLQSFADECSQIVARFIEAERKNSPAPIKLIQGMKIELQEKGNSPVSAIYLGHLVSVSGKKEYVGFFEEGNPGILHYVAPERLSFENAGEEHYIAKSINQVGSRCAAYSMFNCVRQLKLTNFSTDVADKSLAEEESRSSLLVSILNDYYYNDNFKGNLDAITRVMTPLKYKTYGIPRDTSFKSNVEKYVKLGWPTLISFEVPNEMSTVDYYIVGHDAGIEETKAFGRNLWSPKTQDQSKHGAHMVLVQGLFEANGKKKLLVLDPNFQVPRLWDLDTLDNYSGGNIQAFVVHKPDAPTKN